MHVLAWILFAMYLISFTLRASIVCGKIIASAYNDNVRVEINWYRLVLDLVAFVFVCIYLFAR